MNARLTVTVKPGSKRPGIEVDDGTITVRVAERALEGRANEAVSRALAAALRVPPSSLRLVQGAHHRTKVFEIEGLSRVEAMARLA
ncbi:MAG: DUF167 domain-containing protein [Candidatus Eremiobacteraeota bacterium]|nr:DUF167 domain-containing protein [Candidatus Eremiobacteraeota bacterium]